MTTININSRICLDEQEPLLAIYQEALEYETKIDGLLCAQTTESAAHMQRLLACLARLRVAMPRAKLAQLRLLERQARWLHAVNGSAQGRAPSLEALEALVARALDEALLSGGGGAASGVGGRVHSTFGELQELVSVARVWDDKAREMLRYVHCLVPGREKQAHSEFLYNLKALREKNLRNIIR